MDVILNVPVSRIEQITLALTAQEVDRDAALDGVSSETVIRSNTIECFGGREMAYSDTWKADFEMALKCNLDNYARGKAILETHDLHTTRQRKTANLTPEHGGAFFEAGYIATTQAYREYYLTPKKN